MLADGGDIYIMNTFCIHLCYRTSNSNTEVDVVQYWL